MNSTALTTIGEFKSTQVLKSGKEVTRNALGVMFDGPKAGRVQLTQSYMNHCFAEGQFAPIIENVGRIYPTGFATACRASKLDPVTGVTTNKALRSTRQGWAELIDFLQDEHKAKPFKGKKLAFLELLVNAQATYDQRKASLMAAAEQAQKDAGLLIDVVATEAAPLALAAPAEAEAEAETRINADAEVVA